MSDRTGPRPIESGDERAEALRAHYRQHGFIYLEVGSLERERAELRSLLQAAIQLEHATIPPYLTGLYSLKPSAPWRIGEIIRTVVVEEMLHLVLAANTLNAIGGEPVLASPDFIPNYPADLPHKLEDLLVRLIRFSPEFVRQGLAIERPKYVDPLRIARGTPERMTIGEYYVLIESKLRSVVRQYGEAAVFTGDPRRQIQPDMFYYGGAGEPVEVRDLATTIKALQIITDQGEGFERTIWVDAEHTYETLPEAAHYFRFNELETGRLYQAGDTYRSGPTGELIDVPFSDVYPIAPNAKIDQYPSGSEARAHAEAFSGAYSELLRLLERAFRGEPRLLLESVPRMYELRDAALRLIKNPFPGKESEGIHAAPTFQFITLGGPS